MRNEVSQRAVRPAGSAPGAERWSRTFPRARAETNARVPAPIQLSDPMGRRKKTFGCGHSGFGSYCHRCASDARAAEQARREDAARRAERRAWKATLEDDAIDLTGLPRHIVERCREKLAEVEAAEHWSHAGGRKLLSDKKAVVFELGRSYRLLGWDEDGCFLAAECLSHEDYNKRLSTYTS